MLRRTSPALIYAGIGLTILGLLLIVYAWSKTAGQEYVPFQLPYLVSGGLTGLALVMIGLVTTNIGVKRQDAARRARETERVIAAVAALREALQPTDDDSLSVQRPDASVITEDQPETAWEPPPGQAADHPTAPLPPVAPPPNVRAIR